MQPLAAMPTPWAMPAFGPLAPLVNAPVLPPLNLVPYWPFLAPLPPVAQLLAPTALGAPPLPPMPYAATDAPASHNRSGHSTVREC